MKCLVINAGSSSLKFSVFEFDSEQNFSLEATGQVDRLGLPISHLIYKKKGIDKILEDIEGKKSKEIKKEDLTHLDAIKIICRKLLDPKIGVIKDISEIKIIGHRAVHGGEKVHAPVLIDQSIKSVIKECINLAPLHNPANLLGIEACEQFFPNVPNIAIFDTAFHQTMPPEAYLYALPFEYYEKYGIRRYGFHGTSHNYVYNTLKEHIFSEKKDNKLKTITCHLGNGSSLSAIDNNGNVMDTSMGMTPLEGLVMGTRSGDIDPGIVFFLIDQGIQKEEIDKILNKKSGLFGIGGINSGDMRDLLSAESSGNVMAKLAIDIFIRRITKYIAAYHVILDGADNIVFTGGIGENSFVIRNRILDKLKSLNIHINNDLNNRARGTFGLISSENSSVSVYVIPTNEELMIAKESVALAVMKSLV